MNKLIVYFCLNLIFATGIYAQKSVDIIPASGAQGQSLSVSITGVKTSFGAGSNTLQFFKSGTSTNKIVVSNIAVISPTSILASLFIQGSATAGAYTYQVKNLIDGTVNGLNPFIVNPDTAAPKLVSITPNSITQGGYLPITVTGANTHFKQASSSMQIAFYFDSVRSTDLMINLSRINIIDDEHFNIDMGAAELAKLGKYDIEVINLRDGSMALLNSITVFESILPRIVSVSPNLGHLNQTLTVSITGTRTNFTNGSPTLRFFQNGSPTSHIQINSYSVKNDSLLDVNMFIKSTANRGFYSVVYNSGSLYAYKDNAFEIDWALAVEDVNELKNDVHVYPNPAHESLHIESKNALIEKAEIIDLQGRLVGTNTPEKPSNKIDFRIDDFLAPQQYLILKVYTNKGVVFQRVLIQ
jgi:hypothetical protein